MKWRQYVRVARAYSRTLAAYRKPSFGAVVIFPKSLKSLLAALSMLGLIPTATAQTPTCRPEDAQQLPTQWKRLTSPPGNHSAAFPRQSLPAVHARQDKLLDLFVKTYPNPKGLEARAYRNFLNDPDDYRLEPVGSPLHYSAVTYYLHYWCFKGKAERAGETGTWLECYVNTLWRFMDSIGSEYQLANGQSIYYMPYTVGELKGYPVYSTRPDGGSEPRESILITADDRLPIRPVSQEEFIRALQRLLQTWLKESAETTRKLDAALQESTAYADKISFRTESERQTYKDDNRRSVEDGRRLRAKTDQNNRFRTGQLEAMLTAMTPAQRASPAVISNPLGMLLNERGQGTLEEQAKNGRPLVTGDYTYVDRKLPRHAVQFMQLSLRYDNAPDMVAKRALMREFRQQVDLGQFKSLLEKK